jgi:hypothetical protein
VRDRGVQDLTPKATSKGAAAAATVENPDLRPTSDQLYLAGRLNARFLADGGPGGITPAALQRFNKSFGIAAVSDALRTMHGFPPEDPLRSPYAYLAAILGGQGES